MLIAQITDLHCVAEGTLAVSGRIDTNRALEAAVARVNALTPQPDLVLVTGDVTDHGTAADCQAAAARLNRLQAPFRVIPGNHDDRDTLVAAFPNHCRRDDDGFVQEVLDDGPLRILMLDTVLAGRTEGGYCASRLGWLRSRLAEAPQRPTLVAMHHPPFTAGIPFMDRLRLQDGAEALAELFQGFPNVQRIVCGHVHRPVSRVWAGRSCMIAPSTAHQILWTLDDTLPDTWTPEPPGLCLHHWLPEGGMVTHTLPIADAPPITF